MSRDRTIAEATATHLAKITPKLPTLPVYKRLPTIQVESMPLGSRLIYVTPLADETEDETRDFVQEILRIVVTHAYSMNPGDVDPQIEAEMDLAERMRDYLLTYRNPIDSAEIQKITRPAMFDWETAQKKNLFHAVMVLELITT